MLVFGHKAKYRTNLKFDFVMMVRKRQRITKVSSTDLLRTMDIYSLIIHLIVTERSQRVTKRFQKNPAYQTPDLWEKLERRVRRHSASRLVVVDVLCIELA